MLNGFQDTEPSGQFCLGSISGSREASVMGVQPCLRKGSGSACRSTLRDMVSCLIPRAMGIELPKGQPGPIPLRSKLFLSGLHNHSNKSRRPFIIGNVLYGAAMQLMYTCMLALWSAGPFWSIHNNPFGAQKHNCRGNCQRPSSCQRNRVSNDVRSTSACLELPPRTQQGSTARMLVFIIDEIDAGLGEVPNLALFNADHLYHQCRGKNECGELFPKQ